MKAKEFLGWGGTLTSKHRKHLCIFFCSGLFFQCFTYHKYFKMTPLLGQKARKGKTHGKFYWKNSLIALTNFIKQVLLASHFSLSPQPSLPFCLFNELLSYWWIGYSYVMGSDSFSNAFYSCLFHSIPFGSFISNLLLFHLQGCNHWMSFVIQIKVTLSGGGSCRRKIVLVYGIQKIGRPLGIPFQNNTFY